MYKVIALSGYKPYEIGIFQKDHPSAAYIKKAIQKELLRMIDNGLEWVLISGKLGVELWGAEAVFAIQTDYPNLKLAVLTPFLGQEENWNDANKEWYESVLAQADFVDSITKKSYEKPWQFRLKNQFFIEKSDTLLLVYDHDKEGSPKYLYEMAQNYQTHQEYPIHLITFADLQDLIEEDASNHWNP
ncbi:DUF1273 domain-containing protein [Neobacillus sp. SM06]|uniref:DUF1273 domain-containing protein n=1 Tax=Neobacillus sp. SM06 TaxID=3422492 RepID=UPI003D288324